MKARVTKPRGRLRRSPAYVVGVLHLPPSARRRVALGGLGVLLAVAGAACDNHMLTGENTAGVSTVPASPTTSAAAPAATGSGAGGSGATGSGGSTATGSGGSTATGSGGSTAAGSEASGSTAAGSGASGSPSAGSGAGAPGAADVVVGLELRVHQKAGGCWQEFAAGAPAGATRQDTWSPACAGGWAAAVQVFPSPATLLAASVPAGATAYRVGTVRVVVTPAAPAAARAAVTGEPGLARLGA